jgi:hypothetical protein
MPDSCSCGRQNCREVVHQVANQLIVTQQAAPERAFPSNEQEFSNPRFNGQNAAKKRAIAIDLGSAEIWPGQRLVNGAQPQRFQA